MIWCPQCWRESFWNTFSQITLIQLELNSFTRVAGLYISMYPLWICLRWISLELHGWLNGEEHFCPSLPFLIIRRTCNLPCVSVTRNSELAAAWEGAPQSSLLGSLGLLFFLLWALQDMTNEMGTNSEKLWAETALSKTHLLNLAPKSGLWPMLVSVDTLCEFRFFELL